LGKLSAEGLLLTASSFDLLRSFPGELQAAAFDVIELAREGAPVEAQQCHSLRVGLETLDFPCRIYISHRQLEDAALEWPGVRRQIALCLGTRHHDGYYRESCLRRLEPLDAEWKVAFACLLLGDYVIEIANLAAQHLLAAPAEVIHAFFASNSAVIETQRRRAISYWACYYRHAVARYTELPAIACIDTLLARSQLPLTP
jgi:hypothetical protein